MPNTSSNNDKGNDQDEDEEDHDDHEGERVENNYNTPAQDIIGQLKNLQIGETPTNNPYAIRASNFGPFPLPINSAQGYPPKYSQRSNTPYPGQSPYNHYSGNYQNAYARVSSAGMPTGAYGGQYGNLGPAAGSGLPSIPQHATGNYAQHGFGPQSPQRGYGYAQQPGGPLQNPRNIKRSMTAAPSLSQQAQPSYVTSTWNK
jgi:hypothetical protein